MKKLYIKILIIIALNAFSLQIVWPDSEEIIDTEKSEIQIFNPKNNSAVEAKELVSGKTTNPELKVYVLIHPLLTNLWWVQRIPSPPNLDGTWRTLCYFGTPNMGIGEYFEIAAISTEMHLQEGMVFKELPSAIARSDIILVKRTR
jgi:hypothetical protein